MAVPANPSEVLKNGKVTVISKTYCPYCVKALDTLKKVPFKLDECGGGSPPGG